MKRKNLKEMSLRKVIPIIILMLATSVSCFSQFGGGNGSQNNPYQIESPEHLDQVRHYLGAVNRRTWFVQTRDIDLGVPPWNEGSGWVPIGRSAFNQQFMGKYDGNGHVIRGLTINRDSPGQGLFGFVSDGAVLENIGLINVTP